MSERMQRDDRQQEDQRQPGDQDIQRDLVGRLLTLRAFHQRNHAVEEGFAGIRGDPDLDLIGQDPRAACHRAAVAAGFADDWRAFACDHRFIHPGDAFDDFAVARESDLPVSTTTMSPERSLEAGTISILPLPRMPLRQ